MGSLAANNYQLPPFSFPAVERFRSSEHLMIADPDPGPGPRPCPHSPSGSEQEEGFTGRGLGLQFDILLGWLLWSTQKYSSKIFINRLLTIDRPSRMLILSHSSFPWGKEKSFFCNKLWYNILILLHDLLMINIQNMSRILCFYPLRSHLCAIWASNINKTVGAAINWL